MRRLGAHERGVPILSLVAAAVVALAGTGVGAQEARPPDGIAGARAAMLRGDLERAEELLGSSAVDPLADREVVRLAADLALRREAYGRAAELWRQLGEDARAAKLDWLAGRDAYRIEGPDEGRIDFVQTDPLPLVKARVGGRDVLLLVDTGGSELLVDPAAAEAAGVRSLGTSSGTFAGGRSAPFGHGVLDELELGPFRIRNLPVQLLDTSRFSAVAAGRPVSGVVGTLLLTRFLTTLDYPGGALVLRPRGRAATAATAAQLSREAEHAIPLLWAGDHYLLAEGRVGDLDPALLFVDTGLAGPGFAAPASVVDRIAPASGAEATGSGVGGGGAVRVRPFDAGTISLGSYEQSDVLGVAGVFPESLENGLGVPVGGLVSHSFFRPCALTVDVDAMRLLLDCPAEAEEAGGG